VSYAALLADALAANPHERAVLGLYAELLRSTAAPTANPTPTANATHATHAAPSKAGAPGAPGARPRVAEIGCGPGRITAHLASLGLDTQGVDLSPAMIAEARRRHPQLAFSVGSMTALDLPSGSLDGLAAWYSVIHVPPSRHRAVYAGFHRVLRPGGLLLLGFQSGDERRRIEEGYGHTGLALDAYRLRPERVEQDLAASGFTNVTRVVREPIGNERTEQAYLIARALEP
jgi:SAM-dependent methyltransferase